MTSTHGGSNRFNNWMKLLAASAFIVLLSALAHSGSPDRALRDIVMGSFDLVRAWACKPKSSEALTQMLHTYVIRISQDGRANDENEAQAIPSSSGNDAGKARKEGGGNAAQLPAVGVRLGAYPRRETSETRQSIEDKSRSTPR